MSEDTKVDAWVEEYFSRFDKEEENLVDFSESSTEGKEETSEASKTAVKEEQKDTSKTSNTEATNSEEDKNTPFHEHPRWQEKLKSERELKERLKKRDEEFEEMKKEIESLKNKPLTDEELEEMSPKEAAEYAREQALKEFEMKQNLSKKEEEEAEKYIEETLQDLKDEWKEFDENEILKIADELTWGDIRNAYSVYEQINQAKETATEQTEKDVKKRKAAESNSSNRWSSGKVTGYVRWTSWQDLDLR